MQEFFPNEWSKIMDRLDYINSLRFMCRQVTGEASKTGIGILLSSVSRNRENRLHAIQDNYALHEKN